MRKILLAPLILMLLCVAANFGVAQPAKPAVAADVPAPNEGDRVLGKPDAPIAIIEYASLTCPHCAHFTVDILPKLKEKWIDTGKAKLILRDFPLDEAALRAAMVARCVPPERFYPLVDTFFETQEKWVIAKDWQNSLERIAKLAGVGKTKFDSCLADKKLEDAVTQSRLTAATQYGVDATPTFFINGKKFEGEPTVEAFDQLLSSMSSKS